MPANAPILSQAGPDAPYEPAVFHGPSRAYRDGVTPAVFLAGQLNALSTILYTVTVATGTGTNAYAVNDLVAFVTRYNPTTFRVVQEWHNLTQGTFPTVAPTAAFSTLNALPQGENHIGAISGGGQIIKQQWNRPGDTTAYAAGDLLGKTTAVSSPADGSGNALILFPSRVNDGKLTLSRVRLWHSKPAALSVNLHFFEELPTPTVGDNGAFNPNPSGTGGSFACNTVRHYAGKVAITTDSIFSDGAQGIGTPQIGSSVVFAPAFGTRAIYFIPEVTAAYTPNANEAFGVTLELYQE